MSWDFYVFDESHMTDAAIAYLIRPQARQEYRGRSCKASRQEAARGSETTFQDTFQVSLPRVTEE